MWTRGVAVTLATMMTGAPAWAAESLEQRVLRMEQELNTLKAELRKRDEADARRAADATKQQAASEAAARRAAEETAKRVAAEEAAKSVAAAPPAVAPPGTEPVQTAAADSGRIVREITDRVKLGGYGSFRYEGNSLSEEHNTFTYRRFVLTADAKIASRLSSYLELEFERFRKLEVEKSAVPADGGLEAEQAIEATSDSEIALEQAWLQFDFEEWLALRGGSVLVPLGRFNINHDDNLWDLPRRSLVDRGVPVLPSTSAWDELGVGFLGNVRLGDEGLLAYQTYVVNGVALDTEFEQIAQTRFPEPAKMVSEVKVQPSTGTFSKDVKDAKAWTGRVAYSPLLGHEIAGSWYYGQYTPDWMKDQDLWALSGDWRSVWGPFELEGEYVFTRWEGINSVARSLARTAKNAESENENEDLETEVEFELANLAKTKQGYWLELRYRFWPQALKDTFLGRGFDNPSMAVVFRPEQVWLDGLVEEVGFSGGRLTNFETTNSRVDRFTLGFAYRPVPLVVFQLAYEYTMTNHGQSLSAVTNYIAASPYENHSNAILVGAAFGF
jgi:hypothetical protein